MSDWQGKAVNEVTPVVRRKLSQDIFEQLLELINRGDYPEGARLPAERQLMGMFRVGRPAVREALQDLQRLGFVEIVHGEGARVVKPTTQTVLAQLSITVHHMLSLSSSNLTHLKEARAFFEAGMVRLAAAHANENDIRELGDTIAAMEATAADFAGFMKHDMAFHRKIAEITRNPIYVAVSEAILQWLSKYHIRELREVGRESRTLDEHRHILDRIAAHDVEGAAAAMLVHQTRAADLYRPPVVPNRPL